MHKIVFSAPCILFFSGCLCHSSLALPSHFVCSSVTSTPTARIYPLSVSVIQREINVFLGTFPKLTDWLIFVQRHTSEQVVYTHEGNMHGRDCDCPCLDQWTDIAVL